MAIIANDIDRFGYDLDQFTTDMNSLVGNDTVLKDIFKVVVCFYYSELFDMSLKDYKQWVALFLSLIHISTYSFTVTQLPDKVIEPLRWSFEFEYDKNKVMFAYIIKKKDFKKSELNVLDSVMPWHLEYGAIS